MITERRLRLAGHVTYMAEMKSSFKVLVGKSEGKTTWSVNSKHYLKDLHCGGMDWIFCCIRIRTRVDCCEDSN